MILPNNIFTERWVNPVDALIRLHMLFLVVGFSAA